VRRRFLAKFPDRFSPDVESAYLHLIIFFFNNFFIHSSLPRAPQQLFATRDSRHGASSWNALSSSVLSGWALSLPAAAASEVSRCQNRPRRRAGSSIEQQLQSSQGTKQKKLAKCPMSIGRPL
jgi:hypothetical protein